MSVIERKSDEFFRAATHTVFIETNFHMFNPVQNVPNGFSKLCPLPVT